MKLTTKIIFGVYLLIKINKINFELFDIDLDYFSNQKNDHPAVFLFYLFHFAFDNLMYC